jgi:hypothetical protein
MKHLISLTLKSVFWRQSHLLQIIFYIGLVLNHTHVRPEISLRTKTVDAYFYRTRKKKEGETKTEQVTKSHKQRNWQLNKLKKANKEK